MNKNMIINSVNIVLEIFIIINFIKQKIKKKGLQQTLKYILWINFLMNLKFNTFFIINDGSWIILFLTLLVKFGFSI